MIGRQQLQQELEKQQQKQQQQLNQLGHKQKLAENPNSHRSYQRSIWCYQKSTEYCKETIWRCQKTIRFCQAGCKLMLLLIAGAGLTSCAAFDIGHNDFLCDAQPAKCQAASSFLLAQQQHQLITTHEYNPLTHSLVTHDAVFAQTTPYRYQHLRIWFAPYKLGQKVYRETYLIIPYVH